MTTVDHADIRGLGTACLAFVVELPRAKVGSFADRRDPIVQSRILPPWPRPPFQETGENQSFIVHAAISTVRAIAHIKAANSLATAVMATWGRLPFATSRR